VTSIPQRDVSLYRTACSQRFESALRRHECRRGTLKACATMWLAMLKESPRRATAAGRSGGSVTFFEYDEGVNLTIDLDREEDGRWIAEALELPGVMCYGQSRDEAISNAERLAIEVIADRITHGELPSSALGVSFSIPDEQMARQ